MKTVSQTTANMSTMQRHLENHQPGQKTLKGQTTLTNVFASRLSQSSSRAKSITRDICVFTAANMRPFSCGGKSGVSASPPHIGTEVHHPVISALHYHSGAELLQRVRGQSCSEPVR